MELSGPPLLNGRPSTDDPAGISRRVGPALGTTHEEDENVPELAVSGELTSQSPEAPSSAGRTDAPELATLDVSPFAAPSAAAVLGDSGYGGLPAGSGATIADTAFLCMHVLEHKEMCIS